uniref:Protein Wnt n=1 Tax=Timema douglasi TaxID=61478 RepID=A0A7R8VKV3_TIMDO|nr:unnamed protein product [Timema douglasi]
MPTSIGNKVRNRKPKGNWQWEGCSVDIHFGEKFSREFVDVKESRDTAEGLMNLHNNEAGRRRLRTVPSRHTAKGAGVTSGTRGTGIHLEWPFRACAL